MEQERTQGKRKWLALIGSYKYVLIVVAAGILCLGWPSRSPTEPEQQAAGASASSMDLEAIQTEMEEILGAIQGVGELRLMLTVDTGTQRELAGDTCLSYSGETTAPEDYSRTTETVVVSGGSGEDQVVVTRETCPQFRGALVVCQGADDPQVKLSVIEAVSALTGLGSDKISVIRGAGS